VTSLIDDARLIIYNRNVFIAVLNLKNTNESQFKIDKTCLKKNRMSLKLILKYVSCFFTAKNNKMLLNAYLSYYFCLFRVKNSKRYCQVLRMFGEVP
jgi:hypothetical protein